MKNSFVALLAVVLMAGCATVDTKDETRGWTVERIYATAREELDGGNYQRSLKLYETLQARFPYGRYAQQALMDEAYTHYKDAEPELAIASANRFIRLYPSHQNLDYMYYLKGLVYFNEDSSWMSRLSGQDMSERDPKAARESYQAFQELVARFPQSQYSADATEKMVRLINALGAGEVHVARYYMKREAYVAAVNRAQAAIKTYPDAPANEEALFIMIKAYDLLGMNDLRDDAERVMRTNFPKSEYYARGLNRVEPWWKLW